MRQAPRMTSIQKLNSNFSLVQDLIDTDAKKSAATVWGRTSEFWEDIFSERSNFPSMVDFLAFRRADFGYGMADERQGELAREEEHARRTSEIFRQTIDPNRITRLDESPLGAPFVFENFGALRSAAFWTNATTALRISDLIQSHHPAPAQALNVLEIGAGWGCVSSLLYQLLDVASYTIIDLPENLFLSTNYVAATQALRLVPLKMSGPKIDRIAPGSLAFGLPGCLPVLGQKFDVVINSFSLQEMDLATVEGYFSWIGGILAPGGIFLSFNSHGKAGVLKPSDYPLSGLRIRELSMFRAYPTGLLNTIPYEMVLSAAPDHTEFDRRTLDVLGCLIQFGLGENLKDICASFVTGGISQETQSALNDLREFFSPSRSDRAKALSLRAEQTLPAMTSYLRAMDAFAVDEMGAAKIAFSKAIQLGLCGFAKLRACAHIAVIDRRKELSQWDEDFDALFAYPELKGMLDASDSGPFKLQFEKIVSVNLGS
ncbi:putative sugar O-methyltransferase [Rhizobium leguminosarum]|uniref:putative sugar O-methyltransferase n=1 Tax=Rhizobium leguminosarum TaxID=384 RepID=UPI001C91BFEE|nr:putative sugar O-methyltransferase [Rhizobium leguminosarum]MBY2921239.1 putative sugar O-methyltransferase [Rhizobium leguminosarum]